MNTNVNRPAKFDEVVKPAAAHYDQVRAWLERHRAIRDVSPEALTRARRDKHEHELLTLNRLGAIDDDDLRDAFCAITGLPKARVDVSAGGLAANLASEVSTAFLDRHRAIILDVNEGLVVLGAVDPLNDELVRGVRFALGKAVRLSVLRARDERRVRADRLASDEDWSEVQSSVDDGDGHGALEFDRDSPVARRVSKWLSDAVEMRASDVHVEPRANQLEIRYRIDGVLETVAREPIDASNAVLARLKVLADLDLGQRRAAQDGRTTIVVAGRKVDLRVSIVPSVHGETAVLRILDRGEVRLDYAALGFSDRERAVLEDMTSWPQGLFLVTGPTGSGKTTTLYAALSELEASNKKILSVEDPVEFHFDHVTQVQVAPKAGVTFASSIRSFLRQDPDIIMVGEIRDSETAQTAVQAALTGHLVIATLHAIDTVKAVPRLLDMGVEPFQLAACFGGAMSQRLVRRLCPDCRTAVPADAAQASLLGIEEGLRTWQRGDGCPNCDGTGYRGRLSVAESILSDDAIARTIREGADLEEAAEAKRASTLLDDAMGKVREGLTTLEEVERALSK